MFDAQRWAERFDGSFPPRRRPTAPQPKHGVSRDDVLRLIRAELDIWLKKIEAQIYRDISEAIPAHVQRELQRNGGRNQ